MLEVSYSLKRQIKVQNSKKYFVRKALQTRI